MFAHALGTHKNRIPENSTSEHPQRVLVENFLFWSIEFWSSKNLKKTPVYIIL